MIAMPGWSSAPLDAAVPVALLPVRLETRRDGDTLRIRIFPDELSVVRGGIGLFEAEAEAGKRFWSSGGTVEAWERLVREVGAARAPNVARWSRSGVPPRAFRSEGPRAKLLPDRWVALGWRGPELVLAEPRDGPKADVRVGPEPGTQPFDAGAPHLIADPELRWLTDFDAARAIGLGLTVTLPADTALDRLVVLGVRTGPDPYDLGSLLAAHAAQDRLAFVAPGTPTNAVAGTPSGWTSQPPVYDAHARVTGAPAPDDPGLPHFELSRALAMPSTGMAGLAWLAGADDPTFALAGHMARAVAYATLGETIGTLLRLSETRSGADRDRREQQVEAAARAAIAFMGDHVRGAGPLPAIRVGRQPYGVLPVTIRRPHPNSWDPPTLQDRLWALRHQLERIVDRVPALRGATTEDVAGELRRIHSQGSRPLRYRTRSVEGIQETIIDVTVAVPPHEPRPLPGPEPAWGRGTLLGWSSPARETSGAPAVATKHTAGHLRALADGADPGDADLVCAVLRRGRARADGHFAHALRALASAGLEPEPLAALFGDAMATVSTRLDAWFTGLAYQRLVEARRERPADLHLGAWGVVLDLPAATATNATTASGGYVHAPSLDQARTAGVLRAVEHELRGSGGTLASIDLTSDRARAARDILDAVANGQPLGAVLGARLERRLSDAGRHLVVSDLRKRFPQQANVAGKGAPRAGAEDVVPPEVVDGLKVWQAWKSDSTQTASVPADALSALGGDVEGVADVFVAEGVHQIVTGRETAAGATFAALAQGARPPLELDVLATPAGGTAAIHRVLIALPDGDGPAWPAGDRDKLSPRLEQWVASLLGPPEAITGTNPDGTPITLADLSRGALDAVAEAEALAERMGGTQRSQTLRDFVAVAGTIRALLARARPAVPADLVTPPATAPPFTLGADDATFRAVADGLRMAAGAPKVAATELVRRALAAADIEPAGETEADLKVLCARPDGVKILTAVTRALGGDAVVPTFGLTPPADTTPAASSGDVARWLEQHGRVRDAIGALDDLGLFLETLGRTAPLTPWAAQFPVDSPWIGGKLPADEEPVNELRPHEQPRGPRLHLVVVGAQLDLAVPLHALVVDEFVETIPDPSAATGLAIHYDAPSACPPQAILLAVHPGDRPAWDWETLDAIVTETLELSQLRMLDLEDMAPGETLLGLPERLPAAYLAPPLAEPINPWVELPGP